MPVLSPTRSLQLPRYSAVRLRSSKKTLRKYQTMPSRYIILNKPRQLFVIYFDSSLLYNVWTARHKAAEIVGAVKQWPVKEAPHAAECAHFQTARLIPVCVSPFSCLCVLQSARISTIFSSKRKKTRFVLMAIICLRQQDKNFAPVKKLHWALHRTQHKMKNCFVWMENRRKNRDHSSWNILWPSLLHFRVYSSATFTHLTASGHHMYRQFNTHKTYALPTQLYLCVLCGSQNKQPLFPYIALTGWFL